MKPDNKVFLEKSFHSKCSPLHVERSFDNTVEDFFCNNSEIFLPISDTFSIKCRKKTFTQKESLIMYHTVLNSQRNIFIGRSPINSFNIQNSKNLFFSQKKQSSSKCLFGLVESTSDKPAGNFLVKIQMNFTQGPKMKKKLKTFYKLTQKI